MLNEISPRLERGGTRRRSNPDVEFPLRLKREKEIVC